CALARRQADCIYGRIRPGAVLARRRARELQEYVVERRPAEPQVAYSDPRMPERRSGILDQLQPIPRRRHRELVQSLARLWSAAADPREQRLGLVALRCVDQLDLEDLPADAVLELASGALGDYPPVIDHRDPIGELVSLLEVLGGEQDRRP